MNKPADKPGKLPEGYIDIEPLTAEDEKILDEIMAQFTKEEIDEWARQTEVSQADEQARKPRQARERKYNGR